MSEQQSGVFEDPQALAAVRTQMLRFAVVQLGDPHRAEDVVQEALAGALRNRGQFRGEAAFRTWMFSILRRKIADQLRRQAKEPQAADVLGDAAAEDDFAALFDAGEHWSEEARPGVWRDPDGACEDEQFWVVFEICLNNMPETQARYFMMREFIGLSTKEICDSHDLSESNLNVILYRARVRLRECLSQRWFARAA